MIPAPPEGISNVNISLAVTNRSPADARRWIDAAELHYQALILSLRSHRNAIAGIHHLPDELLLEIFSFLSHSEPEAGPSYSQYSQWMLCSRVCAHWRRLALAAPKLWTTVDLGNRTLSREFLARSQGASVDVYLAHDCPPERMRTITALLEPHRQRLRRLRFGVRWTSMEILVSALCLPAPQLEALCLSLYYGRRTPSSAMLIPIIFDGQVPALREIYLDHISIPWSVPIYSKLVDLEIVEQHPSAVPSLEEFLAMLESSPGLRKLVLTNAGPQLDEECVELPDLIRPPIELPSLQELTLNNRALDTAHLLGYLALPPTTSIAISCATPTFRDCFPRDCSALRALAQISELAFVCEADTTISLVGRAAVQGTRDSFNLDVWPGDFTGPINPRHWFRELGKVGILSTAPYEFTLTNSAANLEEDDWSDVLSRFSLYELEVSCVERPLSLFRALQRPGLGGSDVVCPQLAVFTLDGLAMDEDEVLPLAVECFRYRLAQGSPVQTLKLGVSPGMTSSKLQELEAVVMNVEYDEINEIY